MAEQIIGKGGRTNRPNISLLKTCSQSQTLVTNEECIRWGKKQQNCTPAAAVGMLACTGAHKCNIRARSKIYPCTGPHKCSKHARTCSNMHARTFVPHQHIHRHIYTDIRTHTYRFI